VSRLRRSEPHRTALARQLTRPRFAAPLEDAAPDLGALVDELARPLADFKRNTLQPAAVPDDMRFYPAPRPATVELLARIPEWSVADAPLSVTMLVAVSGAGKTSSIFGAAAAVFTVYITCTAEVSIDRLSMGSENEYSTAFAGFSSAVEERIFQIDIARRGASAATDRQRVALLAANTREAKRLTFAFVLAHLVTLLAFLRAFPDATPYQFIRFQCGPDGQTAIRSAFNALERLSVNALYALASSVRPALHAALAARGHAKTVLVAVDEMEGAANELLDSFVSRKGKEGRGLLSPLLQGLRDFADTLKYATVVSGTGSVLSRSESLTSDVGKNGAVPRIQDKSFPLATLDEVASVLSTMTGLPAEEIKQIPVVKKYLASGRFRLTARSVREFQKEARFPNNPRHRLVLAVDKSVAGHKNSLDKRFTALAIDEVDDAKRRESVELLRRVYVASKVSGGRMPFESAVDLCQMGIALVDDAGFFYVREVFVQEALASFFEERLKDKDAKSAFHASVKALKVLLLARGASASGKGDLFENVLVHALRQYVGVPVVDLPYLQLQTRVHSRLRDRSVWKGVKFECSGASRLVEGTPNAASFLAAHPTQLLSPETSHRADGVLLLGPDGVFEFGAKFYSGAVPSKDVRAQYRATSPACAYELESAFQDPTAADRFNPNATAPRTAWTAAGLDRRVALRVHVCVPRSAVPDDVHAREFKPGTFVLDDDSIVVNLDHTNLHLLLGRPRSGGGAAQLTAQATRVVTRTLTRARGGSAAGAAPAVRGGGSADEEPLPPPTDDDVLRALYRVLFEVTRQESFRL